MDSNKSTKTRIEDGVRWSGKERQERGKEGMNFIPYDYEAAFNKAMGDLNEWFIEQMFSHGKKMVYALKEIKAGEAV